MWNPAVGSTLNRPLSILTVGLGLVVTTALYSIKMYLSKQMEDALGDLLCSAQFRCSLHTVYIS